LIQVTAEIGGFDFKRAKLYAGQIFETTRKLF